MATVVRRLADTVIIPGVESLAHLPPDAVLRAICKAVVDIFEIQEQISKAVARALRASVLGEEEDLPGHSSTINLRAFNHYLVGRSHWNRQTEAAFMEDEPSQ